MRKISSLARTGLMAALTLPLWAACGGGGSTVADDAGLLSSQPLNESSETLEERAQAQAAVQAALLEVTAEVDPGLAPKAFTHQDLVSTTCLPSVTIGEAVAKVNAARAVGRMCGTTYYPAAAPLRWNEALARASSMHSQDMARNNYFSHTGLNGSTIGVRAKAQGYYYAALAENISAGRSTMDTTIASWLNSPGHCRNIMSARYQDYGIGCAYNPSSRYRTYWTQMFGAPR